jgi:hypothetical protein
MRAAVVLSTLLLFGTVLSAGEVKRPKTLQIALRGQIVYSACRDEADRAKVDVLRSLPERSR